MATSNKTGSTNSNSWRPPFWKEEQFSSKWDRVKTALMRDWEQTKHDVHAGGHELRQNVGDTVKQATGSEAVPANDGVNPPKVIDTLGDNEVPFGYGYGSRAKFGEKYTNWNGELEQKLQSDWESGKPSTKWEDVKERVKYGYEYKS